MPVPYSKHPSFINQDPWSIINKVSAHLVVFPDPMRAYQSGSCCRIARNLYLTAKHVVADWVEKFGNTAEVWAIHAAEGPRYSIWTVDSTWMNPFSDLALLHTKPFNDTASEDTEWPSFGLALLPPPVGSRIVGYGHHSPTSTITIDASGTRHIVVNSPGAATVGEIREVHNERRDRGRLNFPCFRVNARFDGGMSGGPVVSDAGQVCGVICSSMPPQNEDEEHISYATTLWPLMASYINIAPDGTECQPYPLIELARKGVIQAMGHERVSILTDNDGNIHRIEYKL